MTESSECPHNAEGYCQISTDLAQVPVPIAEDACAACILQTNPRTKNPVTCSKAIQYRTMIGMPPTQELLDCVKTPSRGFGTELESLIESTRQLLSRLRLAWIIPPRAKCGCSVLRNLMNQQSLRECIISRDTITNDIWDRWKKHLPAIRLVPFSRFMVGIYVNRAIQRFKKKESAHG
ncbi:MAG: hypothetical protein ACK5N9_26320 [Pirellula sp.]|jgi:hypothetical protein